MRNALILVSCALFAVIISAVPLPATNNGFELVQIPLQGNKEIDILSYPENAEGKLTDRNKRTIGILRELFPELSRATMTATARIDNDEPIVDYAALSERLDSINRVVRNTQSQQATSVSAIAEPLPSSSPAVSASSSTPDAQSAASDTNEIKSKSPAIDELTLDDEENDENRNKRFLSFGLSGGSGGSGGSGNFLFDIIRLVGGSAGTEQTDERENAPDGEGVAKQAGADGYTEGIPGPVTRLFVLANRGVANLIQDLILRIAQTSERVVNFKARLITSLI